MFSEPIYVYAEKCVLFIFINVLHTFLGENIAAFYENKAI